MKTAMQGAIAFGGWTGKSLAIRRRRNSGHSDGLGRRSEDMNRRVLSGTVDGEKVEMTRVMLRPIPAAEMANRILGRQGR